MRKTILILSLLLSTLAINAQRSINLTVTERATHEPVIMGTVVLELTCRQ